MDDVVGNKGGYNPVTQKRLSFDIVNAGEVLSWLDHADQFTNLQKGVNLPFVPGSGYLDLPWELSTFSAANLSDWAIEAYNGFISQVPTKVSLPNFLYELKDMKGMIPSIDRLSLKKTASNNFLAFEFGVLPFVSDIKAILSLSDSVHKRLEHLLATQGKSTNLSFQRDGKFDSPFSFYRDFADPNANYSINSSPNFNGVEFKRRTASAKFHIGAKLFQDLRDLRDSMAVLKALSAAGGFNSPARVIWNAIPYSFIVDWFFHVGKLLDSLSIQPFGGEYTVSDINYSIKLEAAFDVYFRMANGQIPSKPYLGRADYKSYIRRLGFPVSSLFITDGILSPMQLALSAAMFFQKH